MNMLKYISKNYEDDERTVIDKDGDEVVSSYRILLLAHNSSGFDNWVVLNLLEKETTDLKTMRTARALMALSFRCGVKIVNTVEVLQYNKITCTRLHISGSLDKIGREYGLQPELSKGEINHSEITKHNYNELRDVWEPYLKSDVLCLAFVYARHAMVMQKMTRRGIKESLRETSVGWKCFGLYNMTREFYTFKNNIVRDFIRKSFKTGKVSVFKRYFESKQFNEKLLTVNKDLNSCENEISTEIDKYLE